MKKSLGLSISEGSVYPLATVCKKAEGKIERGEEKTREQEEIDAKGECFKPIMLAQQGKTTMLPVLFLLKLHNVAS